MRSASPWPAAAVLSSVLAAGLCGGPVMAQFRQYTPPGDLQGVQEGRREGLERDLREASWKLGPWRLQPQLSLRNLSYVNDVFGGIGGEEVSDVTAAVGAGLHAYLPLGAKATFALYAQPEYVWWRRLDERRRTNERYGAGLFAYFNRLHLELEYTDDEQLGLASSEIEQQVTFRQKELGLGVELLLRRNLLLYTRVSATEFQYLLDEEEREEPRIADFDRLDRDEEVARAGLRARLRGGWTVDLGAERSEVEFRNPLLDLSHSGASPFLGLELQQGRLRLRAEAVFRSLEAEGGSAFATFDGTTGQAEAELQLRPRLQLRGSTSRDLRYSVTDGFTYAVDRRSGLGLELGLGRRLSLLVFGESGELDYSETSTTGRIDDYTGWGSRLEIELRRKVELQLGYFETEYDSNLPGFDRDVTRLTTNLTFSHASWP